jgi:hypothetical protein
MARLGVRATHRGTSAGGGGPDNKPGHDEGKYVSLIAAWYYLFAFIRVHLRFQILALFDRDLAQ